VAAFLRLLQHNRVCARVEAMSDFSQPGGDGAAPFSMSEWRRGTVYTVRPQILAPLVRGQEYRCTAIVRRGTGVKDELNEYRYLYHRALTLASARAAAVRCSTPGDALYTWIRLHYWATMEIGPFNVRAASVSTSLLFPDRGQDRPVGQIPPTTEQLLAPGGLPLEALSGPPAGGGASVGELYNDFDFALTRGPGMFSYGEYVSSADQVDFEPFVERAEAIAKIGGAIHGFIAREWYCTTHPDLAVIHLYYE
jgi:hypothetical protein